jgi:hypothetical protein
VDKVNDVGNLVACSYAVEEGRSGRSMSRSKPPAPFEKPSELSATSLIEPLKKGGGQLSECSRLSRLSDGPQPARAVTLGCSLLEL